MEVIIGLCLIIVCAVIGAVMAAVTPRRRRHTGFTYAIRCPWCGHITPGIDATDAYYRHRRHTCTRRSA